MTLSEYRAHYSVWSILASPLILDNIGWNPFSGWKILVGFIILVCVGRFAWVTAERDPNDPRLALKLWHRPDQRALSAMTCLVLVALPFVLGTDFDPPMDFPWNSWFRIINYIILPREFVPSWFISRL